MIDSFRVALVFCCLSVLATHAANAQSTTSGADITKVVFSELEKQIIERYFEAGSATISEGANENSSSQGKGKGKKDGKKKKQGLPQGLSKRKELPPGLAKRETLPPGLAKRELPGELQEQLPKPAKGTERVIIEGSVVLIEKATSKVLDVLENIVRGEL